MSTRIILVTASAVFALACSDHAAGPGDVTAACDAPAGTTVFDGIDVYDALAVRDGFVYVELPGAGVQRCPTTGCSQPTSVVDSSEFVSATLGDATTYSTQIGSPDGTGVVGELRAVNADGTNDHAVLGGLTYPAYVAISGARTFFANDSFAIDDSPATIDCVGCTTDGQATPWITGLGGGTYGMMSDASGVYVLADDASLASVSLVACSASAPCFAEPRVVLAGLDKTVTSQQIASDGTYTYVARAIQSDVVRVDATGAVVSVVEGQPVTSIALDAGNLYYGTSTGVLARVRSDGVGDATTLACSGSTIAALALDQTNVYFITGATGSTVLRTTK